MSGAAGIGGVGLPTPEDGPKGIVKSPLAQLRSRVRAGELGSIPVVIGLIVIWIVFQALNSAFLSSENLSNLAQQMAATGTIALGIVLVLLLGEIDLSVGSVSGVTAAILAVLNVNHGMNAVPAVIIALAAGLAIGAIHGFFFTKVGVPTFVVTLAGLIGWQGLQLAVLGRDGTLNFAFNGGIAKLANTYYVDSIGYTIAIVIAVIYAASALLGMRRRKAAGLRARSPIEIGIRAILLGAALLVVAAVMNGYRGVPLALLIFGGLVVLFDLILRRTVFGRQIFAVGGNAEAARRDGHQRHPRARLGNDDRLDDGRRRWRARGVPLVRRQSELRRQRRAAECHRRRGHRRHEPLRRPRQRLRGAARHLVIQSIANGMLLLSLGTDVRFMITGGGAGRAASTPSHAAASGQEDWPDGPRIGCRR